MTERRNQQQQMPARRERAGQVDPWSRFSHEIDRMFDEFWSPSFFRRGRGVRMWSPQVDVVEKQGHLVVKADLPGIRREDLEVEVADNMLTLRGERRQEDEQQEEGWYRAERSYGSFLRTIPLPEGTDPEQVKATFRDGVLEIRMPVQTQSARTHRIEIEGGREEEAASAVQRTATRAQTAAQGAAPGGPEGGERGGSREPRQGAGEQQPGRATPRGGTDRTGE